MGAVKVAQGLCWIMGLSFLACFALATADGRIGRAQAIDAFEPDLTLWSQTRREQYVAGRTLAVEPAVALLRVSSVRLEVPVFAGTDERRLNRGAGLVDGMALPGNGGHLGIAGHRDGFFRALKDVRIGDAIEVRARGRLFLYRVSRIDVVPQDDAALLSDTEEPTVSLVTCYPFYYVGHAPQRFLVRGSYERTFADSGWLNHHTGR